MILRSQLNINNIRFDKPETTSPPKDIPDEIAKNAESHNSKQRFPIPNHPYRPKSDLSNTNTNGTITSLGTFDKTGRDWCKTSIYKEYLSKGAQEFNSEEYDCLLTEDENKHLYDFVKQRYDRQENCQKIVATFFARALNTLKELML